MNTKLRKISKLESKVAITFALLLFCFCQINTAAAMTIRRCGVKKELVDAVNAATEACIISLGVPTDDKNIFKDVYTTFEDRGLILCTLQQMKLANDDGPVDMMKIGDIFFDGTDSILYDKIGKECKEKSDAKFKDEADKTIKARKSTYVFMQCFHTEICPDV